jgi:hypothetical protein
MVMLLPKDTVNQTTKNTHAIFLRTERYRANAFCDGPNFSNSVGPTQGLRIILPSSTNSHM